MSTKINANREFAALAEIVKARPIICIRYIVWAFKSVKLYLLFWYWRNYVQDYKQAPVRIYCTHWVSGLELRLSSILIINASANDYQCDNDGAPPTRASLHLCIVLIKQLIHSCPWLPIRTRCAALLWAIQLLHFDIDTFDSHVTILRRDNLFRKIPVIDQLKGKSHCNSSMWDL